MEKKYRHRWTGSRRSLKTCDRCGCEKITLGFNPEYRLNGNSFSTAPSCVKPARKKYASKYRKPPKKPKGYDNWYNNHTNNI